MKKVYALPKLIKLFRNSLDYLRAVTKLKTDSLFLAHERLMFWRHLVFTERRWFSGRLKWKYRLLFSTELNGTRWGGEPVSRGGKGEGGGWMSKANHACPSQKERSQTGVRIVDWGPIRKEWAYSKTESGENKNNPSSAIKPTQMTGTVLVWSVAPRSLQADRTRPLPAQLKLDLGCRLVPAD